MKRFAPVAFLLLLGAASPDDEAETGKCLPPTVGDVVSAQFSGAALKSALPPEWKPSAARVLAHRIEVDFSEGGRVHTVALVAGSLSADGHGQTFSFRIVSPSSEADRATLLKAARVLDQAIPANSLLTCDVKPKPLSRARTLAIGFAELGVLSVAVVYALWRGRRLAS